MAVYDRLALQLWGLIIFRFVRQKFTEQVHLLAEPSGVLVVGEEIA
jgi:hypothetical protein